MDAGAGSVRFSFHVVTFPNLVREVREVDTPVVPEQDARGQFMRDLAPFARILGGWANSQVALYDEPHAHLVGDALPVAIGRFAGCKQPRVSDMHIENGACGR